MFRTIFILSLTLSACADPCRQVAEQVCACQPDRSRELSCLSEVDQARETNPADEAELQACETVIASGECTCDNLNLGNRAACGMVDTP